MTGHAASTRFAAFAAIVVAVFIAVQMAMAPPNLGASTDEGTHRQRMNVWFQTGWYVPSRFLDEDRQLRTDLEQGRVHAYGPAWSLSAHLLTVVAGIDRLGAPRSNRDANISRRYMTVILGIAAALAVGYAVGVATGRRTAGVWAGAAVLAIPAWAGYSMFHPKDVAVGAGYTMLSAGLVAALTQGGRRHAIVIGVLCGVGVFYGVGTRTAMWLPFVGSVVLFALIAWLRGIERRNVLAVAAGLAVGALGVVAINYRHVLDFYDWFIGSVLISSDFPSTRPTLTAGVLIRGGEVPWYLPAWIGTAIPLGILALAIGAVGLLLARARWGLNLKRGFSHDQAGFLIFAMQATGLPLIAILAGSSVYGGLRQHLYVVPAIAALAGFAAAWLLTRRPGWPVAAALSLALVIPTVEQTLLFPYNYTYRNLLASPVVGRWDAEMHLVSRREAAWMVPADVDLSCQRRARSAGNCAHSAERGTRNVLPMDDRYWLQLRVHNQLEPPEDCVDHGEVSRPLRWERIVMARILLCDSNPRIWD